MYDELTSDLIVFVLHMILNQIILNAVAGVAIAMAEAQFGAE